MVRSSTGSVGLHGFTGERADPTTNLVYLRARDYSPGTARFAQPDPIQPNAAGTHGYNPYWYANNNPGTFTDPTGFGAIVGLWNLNFGFQNGALQLTSLTGTVGGAAAPPTTTSGISVWMIAAAIIVLIALIIMIGALVNCQAHGCTMPTGMLSGWIVTIATEGKSSVAWGITGAIVGACALAWAFTPDILPRPVAQGCGIPDDDCTMAQVHDLLGQAAELAIDVADPTGISSGVFDYAYSAATGDRCTVPPGSGGNCSFSGDTGVLMADGEVKPIAEIEAGDSVLAEDPETGERGAREVTQVWQHKDQLVDLEVDGTTVTTTEDHPFWNVSDAVWQRADQLDASELLLTADGDRVAIGGIDWTTRTGGLAYNLTVTDLHTYFVAVGDADVLVHNTCNPDTTNGWRGTNMTAEQSMNYHWDKHGKNRGVSREQYLADAAAWARTVDPMMGTPTKLQDGSTGYIIRVKNSPGGIIDGNGNIISFWYK
jgi:RHS repeat-associated protein